MAKTPRNKNLKPFTSENQPPGHKKSRKGIPNRATVFKRLLELKTDVQDPEDPEHNTVKVSLYEAAAIGIIKAAMRGNPRAFQEIQDTLFGKQSIKLNFQPEELQNLTDEELDSLIEQLER